MSTFISRFFSAIFFRTTVCAFPRHFVHARYAPCTPRLGKVPVDAAMPCFHSCTLSIKGNARILFCALNSVPLVPQFRIPHRPFFPKQKSCACHSPASAALFRKNYSAMMRLMPCCSRRALCSGDMPASTMTPRHSAALAKETNPLRPIFVESATI